MTNQQEYAPKHGPVNEITFSENTLRVIESAMQHYPLFWDSLSSGEQQHLANTVMQWSHDTGIPLTLFKTLMTTRMDVQITAIDGEERAFNSRSYQ